MKKSKFSEAQVVAILREGEAGVPIAEILRKHGISRPRSTCGDRSTAVLACRNCRS